MHRRGTETVEFIVSFWAFLAMFFLTILVIVVFINALAAQRSLNELAVAVSVNGGWTKEVRDACSATLEPLIGTQNSGQTQCTAATMSGAGLVGRTCRAQVPLRVSVTYDQSFLPAGLGTVFGIPTQTLLSRSMIVLSQSTRGSDPCP